MNATALALSNDVGIGCAGLGRGAGSAHRAAAPRPGRRTSCKTRTRISRSRSMPQRLKCTTRARWRPSPATCRWCRATRRSSARRSSSSTAPSTARRGDQTGAEHYARRRPGRQPGAQPQRNNGSACRKRQQDIRRIEARGGVTVISKDQNASGDLGVYDLKKKTITLTGNVVVSQGKNVLHGERVVVDTTTGNAHFDVDGHEPVRIGSARSFLPTRTKMAGRRTSCRSVLRRRINARSGTSPGVIRAAAPAEKPVRPELERSRAAKRLRPALHNSGAKSDKIPARVAGPFRDSKRT